MMYGCANPILSIDGQMGLNCFHRHLLQPVPKIKQEQSQHGKEPTSICPWPRASPQRTRIAASVLRSLDAKPIQPFTYDVHISPIRHCVRFSTGSKCAIPPVLPLPLSYPYHDIQMICPRARRMLGIPATSAKAPISRQLVRDRETKNLQQDSW